MGQRYMRTTKRERGFTIVEFMIASVVFSVVLLAVTAAMLTMTRRYQHSLYVINTQSAAVNVIQSVSQAVKYSGNTAGVMKDGDSVYCVGNKYFVYFLGKQLVNREAVSTPTTTTTAMAARYRYGECNIGTATASNSAYPHKELLGQGMRVANLSIEKIGTSLTYRVSVRVVYGDNDLLCSPSAKPGSCEDASSSLSDEQILGARDLGCKTGAGSEFCATSELTTLVQTRVQ